MWKFKCYLFVLKCSYICYYIICMTVSLILILVNLFSKKFSKFSKFYQWNSIIVLFQARKLDKSSDLRLLSLSCRTKIRNTYSILIKGRQNVSSFSLSEISALKMTHFTKMHNFFWSLYWSNHHHHHHLRSKNLRTKLECNLPLAPKGKPLLFNKPLLFDTLNWNPSCPYCVSNTTKLLHKPFTYMLPNSSAASAKQSAFVKIWAIGQINLHILCVI